MLEIRKKGNKNFFYKSSDFVKSYTASDLVIIFNGNTGFLRSESGREILNKEGWLYSDIKVYDETNTGVEESFTSVEELTQRLIDLGCPAYYTDGDVVISNLISSDAGNSITTGSDGLLFSTGGGTSQKPIANTYANVTALFADQANQEEGYFYSITDATGFDNITQGRATVSYKGTTNGDESDYYIEYVEPLLKELIVVAEGQSNMVAGDPEIIPYDIEINKNVLIFNENTSEYEVLNPTDYSTADSIYFHFARKYQETFGAIVKIILNAQGGRPISEWTQNFDSDPDYATDRHQKLIDLLADANVSKVDVHLWHQGESNATQPQYVYKLNERLRLLETLPQYDVNEYVFLFGETYDQNTTNNISRAAMLCFENVIDRKNVFYVRSTGLQTVTTGTGTTVHFDGKDLYKFAQRYFEVYQNGSIGRNLQKEGGYHEITTNDSDLWDLTKNVFIVPPTYGVGLILPRSLFRKKYTIINTRPSQVNLTSYGSELIDGKTPPYILKSGEAITLKGYSNYDGSNAGHYKISQSEKEIVLNRSTNLTLSDNFHNAIIIVTGSFTVTIPDTLKNSFRCKFDVSAGTLSFATSGSATLTKIGGYSTGEVDDTIELYRSNNNTNAFRAKWHR